MTDSSKRSPNSVSEWLEKNSLDTVIKSMLLAQGISTLRPSSRFVRLLVAI